MRIVIPYGKPTVLSRLTLLRVSQIALLISLFGAVASSLSSGDESDAPPAHFELEWGRQGSGPGEFNFPIGVAVAPGGEVLVSDFYNSRVQAFSPEGEYVASFETLPNPGGLAIDHEGNVYVSHFSAMKRDEQRKPDRVSVYSPRGKLLKQWGKTGSGDGELDYPGGIAVSSDGRVYVADQTNRRVQVFDREGHFLFKWGEYGVKEGQFGGNVTPKSRVGGPQFVAIDSEGNVYTTEGSVGRIQKFTADGKFLRAWGRNEERPGGFGGVSEGFGSLRGPVGICVDGHDRLWVTAVSGRVQQFTQDGEYLGRIDDGQGTEPAQFQAPHGIASDGHGHLYVADSYNHRIQKFSIRP